MNQQDFIATVYEDNDGRCQLRPHLFSAIGTTLGNVGVHLHRGTAYTTELRIAVPVKQFMAFSGLQVELRGKQIERRTQATHLVLRVARYGLFNHKSSHLGPIFHRRNVQDVRPRMQGYRCFVGKRDGVVVTHFLQHDICLAEDKPVFFHLYVCLSVEVHEIPKNLHRILFV